MMLRLFANGSATFFVRSMKTTILTMIAQTRRRLLREQDALPLPQRKRQRKRLPLQLTRAPKVPKSER